MDKRKYNASGCLDLTPFEAINNIDREEKEEARFKRLLATIFYLCDLAGYHIEERLVLKDKRTGKIWR